MRGKRSNRRLPEAMKARAVKLFAQQKQARQWHDYGPTLAAEELAEHGVQVGKERLRKWLLQAELWKARRARVERAHMWRRRRARWGELLQWDTTWAHARRFQRLHPVSTAFIVLNNLGNLLLAQI